MSPLEIAEQLIEEGKPLPLDLIVELTAMGIELEIFELTNGED